MVSRSTTHTSCRTQLQGLPLVALLIAVVAALPSCATESSEAPERVYLITIDTLRADHVQFLGYPAETTPFLSTLADEGVVFERAYSAAAHTSPAHGSLLSSLYPDQHGALRNGQSLDAETTTMASLLRDVGYQTAAFTSVGFLSGLSAGFEVFDGFLAKADRKRIYRPAHETFERAETWLAKQPSDTPLFVWVHLFDVHEWNQPMAWEQAWLGEAHVEYELASLDKRRFFTDEHGLSPGFLETDEELNRAMESYDRRIRYVDSEIQNFHTAVSEQGKLEQSLWIITADHGEGLFSHSYDGHGQQLYREQLHVPLLLYFSEKRGSGRRVAELVRHVDLLPTLADLVHQPLRLTEGSTLLPLVDGLQSDNERRIAYAQRRPVTPKLIDDGWSPGNMRTVFDLENKYIFNSEEEHQFFDLHNDPLELNNVIETPDSKLAELKAALNDYRKRFDRKRRRAKKLSEETRAELQSLGYTE